MPPIEKSEMKMSINFRPSLMTPVRRMQPMLIIGCLFFAFGFISWLNAILIPYFKLSLQLSLEKAMMVTFAFYISYFVISVPSSFLLKRVGFKKGIMAGFWLMASLVVSYIV